MGGEPVRIRRWRTNLGAWRTWPVVTSCTWIASLQPPAAITVVASGMGTTGGIANGERYPAP